MLTAFRSRWARLCLVAAGVLAFTALAGHQRATAGDAPAWPSQVTAVYDVSFNGFNIGRFTFEAEVRSRSYTLTGDADISALLGFVKWRGLSRTAGHFSGSAAAPAAYTFDYSSNVNSGSVRMAFRKGAVATVAASPAMPVSAATVPVEKSHLKGAIDPLSAVLALTRPDGDNPCSQRLPIYDGMQRFDLVASPLGVRELQAGPGPLQVCEMRYRPISGYARGSETEDLARSMKIEIALLPVPRAGLYVPHEIKIPMLVGSAVLSLQKIDIRTADRDKIAFGE